MGFPATASYPASVDFNHNVFLFDGDSLSLGVTAGTAWALHTLVSAEAQYSGKGLFRNIAVGGRTVAQMISAFSNTTPHRTMNGVGYLFIWGGANSDTDVFADLQSYWALARAAGWQVVAFTILPQTLAGQATRDTINTNIRAATSEYDFLFDTAAILTNAADTLYFSDGVHLTATGYQTMADYINDTLYLPCL